MIERTSLATCGYRNQISGWRFMAVAFDDMKDMNMGH